MIVHIIFEFISHQYEHKNLNIVSEIIFVTIQKQYMWESYNLLATQESQLFVCLLKFKKLFYKLQKMWNQCVPNKGQ